MTKLGMGGLVAFVAAAALFGATAQAVPSADKSALTTDQGELASKDASPVSITVALHIPNLAEAENLLQALSTQGDPQYHQWLSAAQFIARFAPAEADVRKVVASLATYGLAAERSSATTLRVTGSPANIERAFAVSLHSYIVPRHGGVASYSYRAPLSRPTIPAEIAGAVSAVLGLDTRPVLRPLHAASPPLLHSRSEGISAGTGNPSGSLTVSDFVEQYDVKPLYRHGIDGKGRTLGIMTFAALTPSDAFAYWKAVGLKVDPKRLRIVNVDGGPGAPSDDAGSDETTLDVEQSGGIAPAANIVVYQGPNTNQAFVDVIAKAVDANVAESLSISWGFWEYFYNLENSPVIDPSTGRKVGALQAFHELLVRAALQGQSVFAAAGDGGAYDINDDLGCYGPYSPSKPDSCSQPLSVDYPGSDAAITSAGGTTLPGKQEYCLNAACTPPYYVIDLKHEQVWGWDYLDGLCAASGTPSPLDCGTYLVGGGGGVSIEFEKPPYQLFVTGTQLSQPGQTYQAGKALAAGAGVVSLYYDLPAHYAGRNVPDVSFNADPQTGYVIYYTSEPSGVFGKESAGGTSFVAPQLNGVAALLGDAIHGRIGLINYPLYASALWSRYSAHSAATVHPIAYGDNWFYHGSDGYNPGAGLGTLDVANFARFLGCVEF